MCGIFGVYSNNLVVKPILDGLSKLEYRGYDSSEFQFLMIIKIYIHSELRVSLKN